MESLVIIADSLSGIIIASTPDASATLVIAPKFLVSVILSRMTTNGSFPLSKTLWIISSTGWYWIGET